MTYSRGQTISVKNIDSVDAPAFALLYVADSESRDDELVLHVRRPTATDIGASNSGNYVFNGGVAVKAGGYGSAKTGSFGLVMCQNPGLLLGPIATSWYLDGNSAALMFTSVGPDATEASKTGSVKTLSLIHI